MEKIDLESRTSYGMKYGRAVGQGDNEKAALAREFLQIVDGESYIPDNIKVTELNEELDNLHDAHIGFNNFYNEAAPARQIARLVNNTGVPKMILKKFTTYITEAYLTNGNGFSWEANDIYEMLIEQFTDENFGYAITCFLEDSIEQKLSRDLCEQQYIKLLEKGRDTVINPQIKDLISKILSSEKKPHQLSTDPSIGRLAKEIRIQIDAKK